MILSLAPMEGVIDHVMRETLTALGGIDLCVTEFVRVTHYVHSDEIFYKYCPELKTNSRTRYGTPVLVQLLGSQPDMMAANAVRACELGAQGIDLNFGCPAPTVNRHDGGAVLLKSPQRLYEIASAVRAAVPKEISVSAKMRLGYEDPSVCIENAQSLASAGMSWLTIHCRTKKDGYRPPAYWDWIPKIKQTLQLPVVANGEIWTEDDLQRCQSVTGCDRFMIGRAALSDPFLFARIKGARLASDHDFAEVCSLLLKFYRDCEHARHHKFAVARTKQWLKSLALKRDEFRPLFESVKIYDENSFFIEKLRAAFEYTF